MPALTTAPTPKNIERVQALLAENLPHITQRTANLAEVRYTWKPNPQEWSLIELLAHLRSSADLNHFRIYAMLAVDNPILPTIHPRLEWQKIVPYPRLPYAKSLAAYTLQREELLIVLASLAEADWSRSGTWENRRYSIYLVARSMGLHEQEHFEQMERLVEGSRGMG
jgi:hypothetical protein